MCVRRRGSISLNTAFTSIPNRYLGGRTNTSTGTGSTSIIHHPAVVLISGVRVDALDTLVAGNPRRNFGVVLDAQWLAVVGASCVLVTIGSGVGT